MLSLFDSSIKVVSLTISLGRDSFFTGNFFTAYILLFNKDFIFSANPKLPIPNIVYS